MTGGRNADDNTLTPTLMARLESGPHDADVARAVEGIVAPAIGHLDQVLLNGPVDQLGRVDKVRGAELAAPRLLAVVDVDDDDLGGLVPHGALDHREPDAAGAEHGDAGALFYAVHAGRYGCGAVAGRDTAAQEARAVHRRGVWHGHDGDVGDDGVLGERGCAHEVQQILSAGSKAGGAVGHNAAALGGPDLSAEVGLSGLAELAFLALRGAAGFRSD